MAWNVAWNVALPLVAQLMTLAGSVLKTNAPGVLGAYLTTPVTIISNMHFRKRSLANAVLWV